MANDDGGPPRRYAATEIDAVKTQLHRISLSAQFAGAEKLRAFLDFITSETLLRPETPLKESRVGIEVYGRPPDYDPHIDAIVRVEAVKLRTRLAEYYDGIGRLDAVRISVPKGGYTPVFEFTSPRPEVPIPSTSPVPRSPSWVVLAGLAGLLTVLGWGIWRFVASKSPVSQPKLARISPEGETAMDPSISPDGASMVYVSSVRPDGFLNLWLYDFGSGVRKRLTSHRANESSPTFSRDGRWIAYRSDTDVGNISMMPSTGGTPVQLVARGRDPRFSPVASWLAYWVAGDEETGEFGRAFVLDASREREPYPTAEPVFQGFAHVRSPVWCDQGGLLIALGTMQSSVPEKEYDAWALRVTNGRASGAPAKTGLFDVLRSRGVFKTIRERSRVSIGSCVGGYLYLTGPAADGSNLSRVAISTSTGRVRDVVDDLLPSIEQLSAPKEVAGGRMAFGSTRSKSDVWSVSPVGKEPPSQTTFTLRTFSHSLADDGRTLVWGVLLTGRGQSLRASVGQERRELELASGSVDRPVVSPDGRRAAWRAMDGIKQAIDSVSLDSPGRVERICLNCGQPVSWIGDGSRILFLTGDLTSAIESLDVKTRRRSPLLSHPSYALYGPRYFAAPGSVNRGWLTVYAANGPKTRQIFIVPLRDFRADPADHWIPITNGLGWDTEPSWSERGDIIYYICRHGSTRGVWAQPLDVNTKRPKGEAFPVYTSPNGAYSPIPAQSARATTGLVAVAGRLFLTMDQLEGSVWVLQREPTR